MDCVYARVNAAILRQVLQQYSSRLGLDGAAKVAAQDDVIAETLVRWAQQSHRDQPYSITIPAAAVDQATVASLREVVDLRVAAEIPDDSFTHAIARVNATDAETLLPVLKQQFYALLPKGIAVLVCLDGSFFTRTSSHLSKPSSSNHNEAPAQPFGAISEAFLIDLSERAQFERGKTRWTKATYAIEGPELDEVLASLEKALENSLGECKPGHGWRAGLQAAWEAQVGPAGRLHVEAWLMLAMRWDLLTA